MSKLAAGVVHSISELNLDLIFLSAVLFTLGLVLAETVLERNIRWLVVYPTWTFEKIEQWMKKFQNVILTFLFIAVFNSVNLFLGFFSGLILIAPPILAIWTGLNIGIILKKSIGEQENISIWMIFLNPVAVFELPAAWISFSLGIELMIKFMITWDYSAVTALFSERLVIFFWLVIPLLIMAGIIEAVMIHLLQNRIDMKNK